MNTPIAEQAPTVRQARTHNLSDVLRRSAHRYPTKTALAQGDVELSYSELDEAATRIAAWLHANGVLPGERCAIVSRNCWQFAALAFGAARAGVVLVPVNFALNSAELQFIFGHSSPGMIVVQTEFSPVVSASLALGDAAVEPRVALVESDGSVPGSQSLTEVIFQPGSPDPFVVPIDDDAPVRLMYTSGTESRPKGALLSSRSLMWQYVSCIVDGQMSSDDIDLHAMPLYHCAQMDCFLGPDVYLGATSIVAPRPDPDELLRLIEAHGVTKFFAPPTVWIALLRSERFDTTDLSSLKKGYYGASPMPIEVLRELSLRLPDVELWNFYGQTEMSPVATILKPQEQLSHPGSAGRPVLNVETMIVDEAGEAVPTGEVGEIVHRSPHASLGYYNEPDKTEEAFAGGWFHSGDLGRFDDNGLLYIVDRRKDMIKTGGENVASREVEEAIYLLDTVAEVAVFSVPDPVWIEAVTAAVVPRKHAELTADEVISHVKGRLTGYKVPKNVFVVSALPKNPSGKILKRVLRETFGEPGPGIAVAALVLSEGS